MCLHTGHKALSSSYLNHMSYPPPHTGHKALSSKDSPLIKGLRRRIHVPDDSHQRTLLSSKDSLQTTLIQGLSSSCVIGGGYMCQTTLIKGLSSSYFNRIVGKMHKDTSVCVTHPFTCALNRMCSVCCTRRRPQTFSYIESV